MKICLTVLRRMFRLHRNKNVGLHPSSCIMVATAFDLRRSLFWFVIVHFNNELRPTSKLKYWTNQGPLFAEQPHQTTTKFHGDNYTFLIFFTKNRHCQIRSRYAVMPYYFVKVSFILFVYIDNHENIKLQKCNFRKCLNSFLKNLKTLNLADNYFSRIIYN